MTQNAATPPNRPNSNAMLLALCIGAGLLVGAGIMAPFFIKQKNAAEQSMREAQAAAQRAEEAKTQAIALEQQKSELRENLGQDEKTISTLKDDLTARSTALDSLRQSDAEKSRMVETLQADIKAKSDAMTELDTRLKTTRTEVESTTEQNSELTTRVSALRVEISKMSETIGVQGAEITRLVEQTKQQAQQIQVAQKDAEEAHQRAVEAQQRVRAANEEIMSRAPLRIEERHSTQTGRKVAEKSGVPFGAAFDPVGDLFTGIGEGLFGRKGPVILVAVFKDGHEEVMTKSDADLWASRGIRIQRLGSKNTARASANTQ